MLQQIVPAMAADDSSSQSGAVAPSVAPSGLKAAIGVDDVGGLIGIVAWQQSILDDRFFRYIREAEGSDPSKLRRYIWAVLKRYFQDVSEGQVPEELREACLPVVKVLKGLAVLLDPVPLQASSISATKDDVDYVCPSNATTAVINKQVSDGQPAIDHHVS